MNANDAALLVCTNGDEHSRPAVSYGVWLAIALRRPLALLGVVEERSNESLVVDLLQQASQEARQAGLPCSIQLEYGRAPKLIAAQTCRGDYLTVVGPLGRPAWKRLVQGRSFRRIMARVATPLIYVPQARIPMKQILVCMGGLAYGFQLERLSLYLAKATAASINLLHVVEPVNLNYPIAREIQHRWQNILETATPQGENLREALEEAQKTGLQVTFKVRHGNIVHEILEEARLGNYDLVSLGSAFSTHSLRHLYLPNVTAEVAERLQCPVLTVRQSVEDKGAQ
ncbi:MAG: universal stress protein [Anaerolineales bacterium]|nr:universal stress protein [Anaerolineales bacterium]